MAKRLKSNKDIVRSVMNEIRHLKEDRMMSEFPTDTRHVELHELPHAVKALFEEFVCENVELLTEICEENDEKFDDDDVEIDYGRGTIGERTVWSVGIHDATSPFNPSGHDFYALDDGTFIGWAES